METLLLLGVIPGLALGFFIATWYNKKRNAKSATVQSTVLLEKIRNVCKLITVEGEFSEVFAHRDAKTLFFNLLSMEKKALIIVKAKVLIGFDLSGIHIDMDNENRQVRLAHFPEPEILSMETDLEYYDVKKGIINKFSENDLTYMNKKSKEFIRKKVERSYLFDIARNQASETISVIKQLIDSVGWVLMTSYNAIEEQDDIQKKIDS